MIGMTFCINSRLFQDSCFVSDLTKFPFAYLGVESLIILTKSSALEHSEFGSYCSHKLSAMLKVFTLFLVSDMLAYYLIFRPSQNLWQHATYFFLYSSQLCDRSLKLSLFFNILTFTILWQRGKLHLLIWSKAQEQLNFTSSLHRTSSSLNTESHDDLTVNVSNS